MKILEINSVPYGSTCRVMLEIQAAAQARGDQVDTASGYSYHPLGELGKQHIPIGGIMGKLFHTFCARLTGYNGCFSFIATLRLMRKIRRERYSIIHFHNLHGWYLNLPVLTRFIKKHRLKVVWTLHDCWAFTGQCPHYTMICCDKWKIHCHSCPQYREYPSAYVDRSRRMYDLKKKWFTGMDAILVTPSHWLAEQVKQSFLKDYPVRIIPNGIDLSIFQPSAGDFRRRYHFEDKKIVLGVALDWSEKKGLDVFCALAHRLPKDYRIVLVGINARTKRRIPESILAIRRTQSPHELAEIYSAADVFVNPTREDNFPTVNMEALACGTPVITFQTGGSPEIIDETCGCSVARDDVKRLQSEIQRICTSRPYSAQCCRERALQYAREDKFQEYADLYHELLHDSPTAQLKSE